MKCKRGPGDGISITGMSKSEAKAAILKEFPWSMTVEYESDQYQVTDLMAEKVEALLDEIYKDGSDPRKAIHWTHLVWMSRSRQRQQPAQQNGTRRQRTVPLTSLIQQAVNSYLQVRKMVLPLTRTSWHQIFPRL